MASNLLIMNNIQIRAAGLLEEYSTGSPDKIKPSHLSIVWSRSTFYVMQSKWTQIY